MIKKLVMGAASLFLAGGALAGPVTINFEDLATGASLSDQYASLGVTFSPNAFTGAGSPTGNWATNTNLIVVSSTGPDTGGLGGPSLVSGNIVRSFDGWLAENGDPSFTMNFSTAISEISLDFAGVATPAHVVLYAYDGDTLLGSTVGAVTTGQFQLSYSGTSISRVSVEVGDFFDWVGFDNLSFTQVEQTVPEPGSLTLAAMALALLSLAKHRQTRRLVRHPERS